MATALAERNGQSAAVMELPKGLEKVLIMGDLADLKPEERIAYYRAVCNSLGLNPLTKPFDYMLMKGEGGKKKLQLYANKSCTDQLRDSRSVSVKVVDKREESGLYLVTVTAKISDSSAPDGIREDTSVGAITLEKEDGEWQETQDGRRYFKGNGSWLPLRGEDRANAIMKAETKSKRRVTLSICGLGFMADWEPVEFVDEPETSKKITPPVDDQAEMAARNRVKAAREALADRWTNDLAKKLKDAAGFADWEKATAEQLNKLAEIAEYMAKEPAEPAQNQPGKGDAYEGDQEPTA